MQHMWEALPGNAVLKTESFIVPKNGYIQCAFLTKCVATTSLINGHTPAYMPVLMAIHLQCEHQASQFLHKINSNLAGCMPQQKTALTPISSWRAWASSSLCTLPKLPGRPLCVNLREHTDTG